MTVAPAINGVTATCADFPGLGHTYFVNIVFRRAGWDGQNERERGRLSSPPLSLFSPIFLFCKKKSESCFDKLFALLQSQMYALEECLYDFDAKGYIVDIESNLYKQITVRIEPVLQVVFVVEFVNNLVHSLMLGFRDGTPPNANCAELVFVFIQIDDEKVTIFLDNNLTFNGIVIRI